MGYEIDYKGLCSGIATMALQAIIAKNIRTFEERRNLITRLIKIIIQSISFGLDSANKYLITYQEILKSDKNTAEEFLQQLRGVFNHLIETNAIKPITILELKGFIDGIVIHQNPSKYKEFIPGEIRGQNFRVALSVTSPVDLEKNGIYEFKPMCYSFTMKELTLFLEKLKNDVFCIGTGSKAVVIGGDIPSNTDAIVGHAITIGYNPERKEWYLIESDQSLIKTENHNIISKEIMKIYGVNVYAYFTMDFYGNNSEKELLAPLLAQIQNELMNNIKMHQNQFTASDLSKLLFLAVSAQYEEWVECILASEGNPNSVDEEGFSLLDYAITTKNLNITSLLIKYGAQSNLDRRDIKNKFNETPVEKIQLEETGKLTEKIIEEEVKNKNNLEVSGHYSLFQQNEQKIQEESTESTLSKNITIPNNPEKK